MGKKIAGLVLADHSGSMSSCSGNAAKAINDFFTERANAATTREEWALDEFDDHYDQVFGFTDVAAVPGYVLKPRGMTALHDSIAASAAKLESYKSDKDKLRILVIVTDGYENASKEHNAESSKKTLDEKRAKGWQVIYLGANQDAVKVAEGFGVSAGSALTYSTKNSDIAMRSVSHYVSRGSSRGDWGFTADERSASK